ncbi:hypothetical protein NL676_034701 [Syzygium grande]|nr:hypothetical protein NL676_034701 [Syzygium grande]
MEVAGPGTVVANGHPRPRCMSSYVNEGSTKSHHHYLARKTLLEMFRDRGYTIASSEIDPSPTEFRTAHDRSPNIDRLHNFKALHSDPSKRFHHAFF